MKLQSVVPGSALIAGVAATQAVDLDIYILETYRLVNVSLGTPPVVHPLLFDTGSSSLWLVDSECGAACPNTSGAPRTPYNVSASSTGVENRNASSDIDFLGGLITGVLATDVATIGDLSFNQTFAPVIKSTWQNLPADGFLGLASSTIGIQGTQSFFENMLQQGLAALPRFGIYLGSASPNESDPSPPNNGVLTFGGSREADFAKEPARFVDVTMPFEVYTLPMTSFNVTSKAGKAVNIPLEGNVVIDTGSALFSIPQQYIGDVYSATPWSYQSLLNRTRPLCSEFTDDWSISFTLGVAGAEEIFTVPGSQLGERGYQDDDHCFPPFNPWDSEKNIIIGSIWLKNFYSVFDFGSQAESRIRVGFAPLKDEFRPRT